MDVKIIRNFRHNLRRLERIIGSSLRHDTCCHGVSIAQCHTLLALEQLGCPNLGELATELELDKSTLSRTIEGLVRRGLVQREADSADRRSISIALTPDGQEICDGINQSNDDRYRAVLASINRDPREMTTFFSELVQAMAPAAPTNNQCNTKKDKHAKRHQG
jgi:DNA-binding MarR family transcriptional regulator